MAAAGLYGANRAPTAYGDGYGNDHNGDTRDSDLAGGHRAPGHADPASVSYNNHVSPNYRCWIPGDGIRRDVIQADIQRYLGPDALVKPGVDQNGRSGYWIAAARTLTPVSTFPSSEI
jgi:hypothetical protein